MYQDTGFFCSHESDPIHGTAMNYSGLSAMASSSSNSSNLQGEKLRLTSFSPEDHLSNHNPTFHEPVPSAGLVVDFQTQFGFNLKQELNNQLMQDSNYQHCSFDSTNFSNNPLLFQMLASGNFHTPSEQMLGAPNIFYDPQVHLDLLNQPPLVRDVLQSLGHDHCGFVPGSGGSGGSMFDGVDEGYGGQFEGQQMEFKRQMRGEQKGSTERTERQRRERFSAKYDVLKSLIPNPTKHDRATIIADTIEYIKELLRTLDELKVLVEKKRRRRERSKKLQSEGEVAGDMESSSMKPLIDDRMPNGSLRSSWLQRKSKETLVDVRIVEDEVNIKLTQRKKINCLLVVSKVLDEFQLELLHIAGGNIGDYQIFMFNTKIHEGSSVYASAIAKKLIEVMDLQ